MARTLGSQPRRRPLTKPRFATHRGVRLWMNPTTRKWTLASGDSFKSLKSAKAYINKQNNARTDLSQTTSELTGVAMTLPLLGTTTSIASTL